MPRLNNYFKFGALTGNMFIGLISFIMVGTSMYSLLADWGTLDAGFFLGIGISGTLLGGCLFLVFYLGFLGVAYQVEREGNWTGRRVLAVYQACCITCFISCLLLLFITSRQVASMDYTRDLLIDNPFRNSTDYDYVEVSISEKFDEFFFAASATSCSDSSIDWFWNFVRDHCAGLQLGVDECRQCVDGMVAVCAADEAACSDLGDGTGCPYDICRIGILEYFSSNLAPFSYCFFVVAFLFFSLIFTNFALICFTRHDTQEEMLVKAGTSTNKDKKITTAGASVPTVRRHTHHHHHHDHHAHHHHGKHKHVADVAVTAMKDSKDKAHHARHPSTTKHQIATVDAKHSSSTTTTNAKATHK